MKIEEQDFGEDLVHRALLTREQMEQAGARAGRRRESLRDALMELRILTTEQYDSARAAFFGIPYMSLAAFFADPQVLALVSEDFARSELVFPLFRSEATIAIAISDPTNLVTVDQIRADAQLEVDLYYADAQAIVEAIGRNYSQMAVLLANDEDMQDTGEAFDVPHKVESLLHQCVRAGASDLHIEPGAAQLLLRQRIDGVLQEVAALPSALHAQIVSRIKVLAGLDITETRLPQDGQIQATLAGEDVSLRVSTVPTLHGENCVIRFLVSSRSRLDLGTIGMAPETLQRFSAMLRRPHGMLIVTGPTGSGKTSTLYAALDQLNTIRKNIMTIEDPVEYTIDLLRQIQVNERAGLTFAAGLRAILRQDPDVVMVGEIRDEETAAVAVHAALTGHVVLTTLHTNDAAGAVTRLIHMGIPPFLIASSLIGVVAQRLVRVLCPACARPHDPAADPTGCADAAGYDGPRLVPVGCARCHRSGYRGRTGIYELLEMTPDMQQAVLRQAPASEYEHIAIAHGMVPLFADGLRKVRERTTSLEEVMAVSKLSNAVDAVPETVR